MQDVMSSNQRAGTRAATMWMLLIVASGWWTVSAVSRRSRSDAL
jgi:hypothetical protein